MERVPSRDEGMENYGTGVGMGDSRDLRVL